MLLAAAAAAAAVANGGAGNSNASGSSSSGFAWPITAPAAGTSSSRNEPLVPKSEADLPEWTTTSPLLPQREVAPGDVPSTEESGAGGAGREGSHDEEEDGEEGGEDEDGDDDDEGDEDYVEGGKRRKSGVGAGEKRARVG